MEFFRKTENKKILCTACARNCEIDLGQVGYCGVRKNEEGKLSLLNYSRLLFLKKQQDTMFVGSVGSNMRMNFDLNWDSSLFPYLRAKEIGREKTNEEIQNVGYRYLPSELVNYAKSLGCKKICFGFNEPLTYIEYILEVCELCKKENIETGLITTGYFSEDSLEKTLACIDEITFYFFSTFEKFYIKHCKAQLSTIQRNILDTYKSGVRLNVFCLLIPDENDSEKNIENVAIFLKDIAPDISLSFLKYIPSYRMLDKEVTTVEKLREAVKISKKVGLKNVDFVA
jgi:pyruvate formate lyase activating enzyme